MDIITYAMTKSAVSGEISSAVAQALADLPKGIVYLGAVNYISSLPANPSTGDAYTVKYKGDSGSEIDGTEYVWGNYEGSNAWIALGPDLSQYLLNPGNAQDGDVLTWNGQSLQWREPLPVQGNEGQVLTKTQNYWEWADSYANSVSFLTEAPTGPNATGLKFVVLSSEP